MAAAGAALGWLDKQGFVQSLPKLPVLGEHGTVALAAMMLPGVPYAGLIAKGAGFLAAYEFVKLGQIQGEQGYAY